MQRAVRLLIRSPFAELVPLTCELPREVTQELRTLRKRFEATEDGIRQFDDRRQFFVRNSLGGIILFVGFMQRVLDALERHGCQVEIVDLRKANPHCVPNTDAKNISPTVQRAVKHIRCQIEFASDETRLDLLLELVRYMPQATFNVIVQSHAESRSIIEHLGTRLSGGVYHKNDGTFWRQPRLMVTFASFAQPYRHDVVVFFDARTALKKDAEFSLGGVTEPIAIRPEVSPDSTSSRRALDARDPEDVGVRFQDMTGVEYHRTTQPIFAFRPSELTLSRRKEVELESRVGHVLREAGNRDRVRNVLIVACDSGPQRKHRQSGREAREKELWQNRDRHQLINNVVEQLVDAGPCLREIETARHDESSEMVKERNRRVCIVVDSLRHATALVEYLNGWQVLSTIGERFPGNRHGLRRSYDRSIVTTKRLSEVVKHENNISRIGCDAVIWAGGGPNIPDCVLRLVRDVPGRFLIDVHDTFNSRVSAETQRRHASLCSDSWTVAPFLSTDNLSVWER